jgi:hypothetical protein
MTTNLAQIVAEANIARLSLIGLSKNVGKTTTTNHLLESLLRHNLYHAEELAITSLGLDGEAIDALTGLPKPRYAPQAGILVATTEAFVRQAESEGAQFERLQLLTGRTALGSVMLARVLHPGRIVIAGPTLLRELRAALDQMRVYGARLSIIDGAINRLGAAATDVTDACIVCTGTSVGATPELVARRTADVIARLTVPQSTWTNEYKKLLPEVRLLMFSSDQNDEFTLPFTGQSEPVSEAQWIVEGMETSYNTIYLLRGALTEELSRELLGCLAQKTQSSHQAEIVVGNGTKVFCHSVTLQRLAARGLHVSVATSIQVLALTINPFTPEYNCSPQQLLEALVRELPTDHPPILDVVSGIGA